MFMILAPDSTLLALQAAPGRWAGRAQCQVLGSWSGKGALLRQAGLLHLLRTLLYPRPLVGTCLEAGRRDPTHAQSFLLCGEQTAPLQIRTLSAPQVQKVSGAPWSGLRLSFTLSSGAQRPPCSPSPEAPTPAPGPRLPQPAEEVGRGASGRRSSGAGNAAGVPGRARRVGS